MTKKTIQFASDVVAGMKQQPKNKTIHFSHAKNVITVSAMLWILNQIFLICLRIIKSSTTDKYLNLQPVAAVHPTFTIAHSFTAISMSLCFILNIMTFVFSQRDSIRMGALILGTCNGITTLNYLLTATGLQVAFAVVEDDDGQQRPINMNRSLLWISSTMCQVFFIAACTRRKPMDGYKQCIRCVFIMLFGLAWDFNTGVAGIVWLILSFAVYFDLVRNVWLQIAIAINSIIDNSKNEQQQQQQQQQHSQDEYSGGEDETTCTKDELVLQFNPPFLSIPALHLLRIEWIFTWTVIPIIQVASRCNYISDESCEYATCAMDHVAKVFTAYIVIASTAGRGIASLSALKNMIVHIVDFAKKDAHMYDSSVVNPLHEDDLDHDFASWLRNEFYSNENTKGKIAPGSRRSSMGSSSSLASMDITKNIESFKNENKTLLTTLSEEENPDSEISETSTHPRLDNLDLVRNDVNSYDWDAINKTDEEKVCMTYAIFEELGIIKHFMIDDNRMLNFLDAVKSGYNDAPYHNWEHAVTVTHTMYLLLSPYRKQFTPFELLASIISAICHDIGHKGVNNTYNINTKSTLATIYNDISVLENYHAHCCFKILYNSDNNILESLSFEEFMETRDIIINNILGTDMTFHQQQKTDLSNFLQDVGPMNADVTGAAITSTISTAAATTTTPPDNMLSLDAKQRKMLLRALLHCSDLYSSFKPFDIAKEWATRITDEFTDQTFREEEQGLPWQPFMRCPHDNTTELAKGQIGFVTYVSKPWWAIVGKVFPSSASHIPDRLDDNIALWQKAIDDEAQLEEAEESNSKKDN